MTTPPGPWGMNQDPNQPNPGSGPFAAGGSGQYPSGGTGQQGQPGYSGYPGSPGYSGDGHQGYGQPGAAGQFGDGYQGYGGFNQPGVGNQGFPGTGYGDPFQTGYSAVAAPAAQPSMPEIRFHPIDATESFTQGAKALFSNFLPWALALAAVFVGGFFLVLMAGLFVAGAAFAGGEGGLFLSMLVSFLLYAVLVVMTVVYTLNSYRCAIRQVRGERVRFGDFFRFSGLLQPLGVSIVVGVVVSVGLLLLVVPGVLAIYFFTYVMMLVFAIRGAGFGDPFRVSFDVARRQVGPTILLLVFAILLNLAGSLIVVGVIVTAPLALCMTAHATQKAIGAPLKYFP